MVLDRMNRIYGMRTGCGEAPGVAADHLRLVDGRV
jgi:hypothetical protein